MSGPRGAGARRAARKAANSRGLTGLARAGYAASGLVHLLIGYLAIMVAFHHAVESDQSGALAQLAKLPGGAVTLWVTVVGLAALGLWHLMQAGLGIGSAWKSRWVRSLMMFAKALAYLALAATALSFAQGHGTNTKNSTRQASGTILAMPGGPLLLGLIGLVAVGVGAYFIYKGARQKFRDDIRLPGGRLRRPLLALGVGGYVAKGIAIVIVGVLFAVAAVKADTSNASGLDGALKSLAALPFGGALLVVVGAGLIGYGVYTFARARLALL
jgi:hypothetical protein